VSIVQKKEGAWIGSGAPFTVTFDTSPTEGNTLIGVLYASETAVSVIDTTGWTELCIAIATFDDSVAIWTKVAGGSELPGVHVTAAVGGQPRALHLYEVAGLVDDFGTAIDTTPATITGPTLASSSTGVLIAGVVGRNQTFAPVAIVTPVAPLVEDWPIDKPASGRTHKWSGSHATTADSYTPEVTVGSPGEFTDPAGMAAVVLSGSGGSATPPDVIVADPLGVQLVAFDDLLEHRIRVEYNGTGSGYLVINRHDPQATAANLAKGNIVRVTYPEIQATPVFEWIIEDGDFDLVSSDEEGGEDLTFSGRGTLALLEQAILGHQNLTDPPRHYPAEGVWRWTSEEWAGILRRLIDEAQAHSPPALSMLTRDWSDTTDSNGSPFFDMDGDWEIAIGTDLLTAGLDLARAGMGSIEMRPGFLLRAYDGTGQGRDLSGAFGISTVRFQAGVNITTEVSRAMEARRWASNVLIHTKDGYLWFPLHAGGGITGVAATDVLTSSTAHGLAVGDPVQFTAITGGAGLVEGTRYYVVVVPSSTTLQLSATVGGAVFDFTTDITGGTITSIPYTKEVLLDLSGTSGTNTQERAAARRLLRGEEANEGVIFEASPIGPLGEENTPASGWYYPGYAGTTNGKYWVGDLVTFHTGTEDIDFNAQTFRIQAITLGRDEAGQFAPPIIELNSPWGATSDRASAPSGSSSASSSGSAGGATTKPHVHTQYALQPVVSASDPTVNDDTDDGYGVGRRWLNTTTDAEFVLLDSTAGAAVWLLTTVTDHGALTGLADDDHPQYATAADLTAHIGDAIDAHDASAISFTPTGTIAATDVQAAIAEVAAEAGSGVTLSDDTPLVESGTGDEGTSGEASRSDHVHPADGGGGGGGTRAFGLDPATPDATYGDEFTGASLDAKWSRHNQTAGEETYQSGGLASTLRVAYSTATASRYIYQTAPNGTNETWTTSVSWYQETNTGQMFALLMVDSSGNGVAALPYDNVNGLYLANVTGHVYTSSLASISTLKPPPGYYQSGGRVWIRLRKATGLYAASYSLDGQDWSREATGTPTAFTPARVGIGRILGNQGNTIGVWHFFDKAA
jgi:hypothetical protein